MRRSRLSPKLEDGFRRRSVNVDALTTACCDLVICLQYLIMSSVGANEYSLSLLSKSFKPFSICPDKRTFQLDNLKAYRLRRHCRVGRHKKNCFHWRLTDVQLVIKRHTNTLLYFYF